MVGSTVESDMSRLSVLAVANNNHRCLSADDSGATETYDGCYFAAECASKDVSPALNDIHTGECEDCVVTTIGFNTVGKLIHTC